MNLLRAFCLFLSLWVVAMTTVIGCKEVKESDYDHLKKSPFAGVWMDDQILAYKEYRQPQYICAYLTANAEAKDGWEWSIEAIVINDEGHVHKYFPDGSRSEKPLWKVLRDGVTFSNIYVDRKAKGKNTDKFTDHSMKMDGKNKILSIWKDKESNGKAVEYENEFFRMSEEELKEIQQIYAYCKSRGAK